MFNKTNKLGTQFVKRMIRAVLSRWNFCQEIVAYVWIVSHSAVFR